MFCANEKTVSSKKTNERIFYILQALWHAHLHHIVSAGIHFSDLIHFFYHNFVIFFLGNHLAVCRCFDHGFFFWIQYQF